VKYLKTPHEKTLLHYTHASSPAVPCPSPRAADHADVAVVATISLLLLTQIHTIAKYTQLFSAQKEKNYSGFAANLDCHRFVLRAQ
jgi:hypothetical protein